MSNLITGMHHVTAMASAAQSNLDFYTGILEAISKLYFGLKKDLLPPSIVVKSVT